MGNRLTPAAPVRPWREKAVWFLGALRRLLGPEPEPEPEAEAEANEPFQISFNLVRHLFDLGAVAFLCLASPLSRACLDVLGLRGLPALWLHGLALFLATSYGMNLLLWLLHAYLTQLTLAFGALHLLVLAVSLHRARRTDTPAAAAQAAAGPSTPPGSGEGSDGDGTSTCNETTTSYVTPLTDTGC
ncbi:uncharacterized protein C6orf47 homolog [Narcine bancroftii]|uniref:uncharacterized protein C6orf47 homolog n=1 Tax=Narcine bancroftii TaxID=1343680 RepID=UPI003831ADD3